MLHNRTQLILQRTRITLNNSVVRPRMSRPLEPSRLPEAGIGGIFRMKSAPASEFCIRVVGARQHNLKNIDVVIPRDTLTVITGLSGAGKSSLAFDTIYAEGKRKYVESLSAYARQFLVQFRGRGDRGSRTGR